MNTSHLGELAAFATAICWTITGINFELAGKRVGSFAVNIIRLIIAFVIMSAFNYLTRGMLLPFDATAHAWIWLSISGLIGFVIGDLFLFQAYVLIGARISMLIMAFAPTLTAIFGYFILGESIGMLTFMGILLTVLGIALVVFTKPGETNGPQKLVVNKSIKGLVYAFLGAIGQAFGLIASKIGMGDYDAFASTQIRIMAGIVGFLVLYAVTNRWKEAMTATKDKRAMTYIFFGSVFGPFLGVSLSLIAVQNTETAIASTIMSIMPILIIPFSIVIFKEKVNLKEVMGALITVSGVAILFL